MRRITLGCARGRTLRSVLLLCAVVLAAGPQIAYADELPGAAPFPAQVKAQITKKSRGAKSKFTNRLILETSPYLLQHAHNPVDWHAWGPEAFRAAKQLGRPIFLSIGYFSCHWCHVMEDESFSNEEVARFINANYVAIKVDREEHPEVDAIYLKAVDALTGSSGWPLNVWLTPDGKPFFGSTYVPRNDGDRGEKVGFMSMLKRLAEAFKADRTKAEEAAAELTKFIQSEKEAPLGGSLDLNQAIRLAGERFVEHFDPEFGGIEEEPKFPSSFATRFLQRLARHTNDAALRDKVYFTLRKMAAGGIYDCLGGGFHRYSTDKRWEVPHFEKMTGENALLALAYLDAFQASQETAFAQISRNVLNYLTGEMLDPSGGFYSALDADSPDSSGKSAEGAYYLWSKSQVESALTAEERVYAAARFALVGQGDLAALQQAKTPLEVQQMLHLAPVDGEKLESSVLAKLAAERQKRSRPAIDTKIIAGTNGLVVSALAKAAFVLQDAGYLAQAKSTAQFLLDRLMSKGTLQRSLRDGKFSGPAYLDDYALVIAGLLDVFEVSGETKWLRSAIELQAASDARFSDPAGGAFFLSEDLHGPLIARIKPDIDSALPSGNSVTALNLMRLGVVTSEAKYKERARKIFLAFAPLLSSHPELLSELLIAADFAQDRPKEIVVVGDPLAVSALLEPLRKTFYPNRVVVIADKAAATGASTAELKLLPVLRGKTASAGGGAATVYFCEEGVCKQPTSDAAVLKTLLTPSRGA